MLRKDALLESRSVPTASSVAMRDPERSSRMMQNMIRGCEIFRGLETCQWRLYGPTNPIVPIIRIATTKVCPKLEKNGHWKPCDTVFVLRLVQHVCFA